MLNKKFKRRLWLLLFFTLGLASVIALISYALRQNISLYYTPSQIFNHEAPQDRMIRVGGMVVKGSVQHQSKHLSMHFQLTDFKHQIQIHYQGILPDLFREGQGIVVKGKLIAESQIEASEVLAKHDENYMPAEVRDSLQGKV